ncbi:MAG: twin-arginine translocation signal domain-containing protein [Candidatus Diapherotrites archaeon]|nr:twin-arginine translocation signal domain-containing protein [Candidatus Diapherotrites archaeon]
MLRQSRRSFLKRLGSATLYEALINKGTAQNTP